MFSIGKFLVLAGVLLVVLGLAVLLLEKVSWLHLGRLPGDIRFQHGHFSFYFPIVTCLVISVILTLLLSLFRR
ncbi:MAG: DUF2905 domain-containing protein [Acidobacteriia bacterium]|nr:DUF2905 domain-containing protein [Terriglobia bacterium]